jgi:tetratricopeptide (TPR) repeat protein
VDRALALCDEKLAEYPDDATVAPIVYNLKGSLLLAERNRGEAETAFKKAIEMNPNFLRPYYTLARIYLSENRADEAVAQYESILDKDPKQAGPHMMMGTIYEMQQQYDLAEQHYRKTLEIDPDFAPAANNLAYILANRNENLDEALVFARKAKEILPDDANVMDTLGWIYYHKGFYDNAIAELRDALNKLPDNPTVHYHLAMAYYKNGETDKAKALLEKALSLADEFEGAEEARQTLAQL